MAGRPAIEFTVLCDKGFHTGSELKNAQELGVETIAFFFKQLPTHVEHIAKAPHANAKTKALSKSAIILSYYFAMRL